VTDRAEMAAPAERLRRMAADIDALQTHVTRIVGLVGRSEEVPYALLKGAVDKCEEALVEYQTRREKEILKERDHASESVFDEQPLAAQQELVKFNSVISNIFGQIDTVRSALAKSPKRDAAYVIMLQRLHPAETINLASANSARDVHPGKEEDLRDLLRIGGHNLYSCPGNGMLNIGNGDKMPVNWVSSVGDWVEAIPLFIHERVIRKTRVVAGEEVDVDVIETAVDQEAMEGFFRAHAEYWAQNIDAVEDSICVELARQIVVEKVPSLKKAASKLLDDGKSPSESARLALKAIPATHKDVATIAAAIAMSSLGLLGRINETVEKEQTGRLDAIRKVLFTDNAPKSLIKTALDSSKRSKTVKALADACRKAAKGNEKSLLEETSSRLVNLVSLKTRRTPSLHILTTESAGMTEGYVQSWIEEEISLYKVVRGEGLESAVKNKMKDYRTRIAAVGNKVIDEFGMSVVVDEVMAEQKLDRGPATETVIFSLRASLMASTVALS